MKACMISTHGLWMRNKAVFNAATRKILTEFRDGIKRAIKQLICDQLKSENIITACCFENNPLKEERRLRTHNYDIGPAIFSPS